MRKWVTIWSLVLLYILFKYIFHPSAVLSIVLSLLGLVLLFLPVGWFEISLPAWRKPERVETPSSILRKHPVSSPIRREIPGGEYFKEVNGPMEGSYLEAIALMERLLEETRGLNTDRFLELANQHGLKLDQSLASDENARKALTAMYGESSKHSSTALENMRNYLRAEEARLVRPGPSTLVRLKRLGGFPDELLEFAQKVGSVTLNGACYFNPDGYYEEDGRDLFAMFAENLGLAVSDLRIIGGDHGEGLWAILTRTGEIIYFEQDMDYSGKTPQPGFGSFLDWVRINLVLGLVESFLEEKGVDSSDLEVEYAGKVRDIIRKANPRLTDENWPYRDYAQD